jgi:hypothetical protein
MDKIEGDSEILLSAVGCPLSDERGNQMPDDCPLPATAKILSEVKNPGT